MDFHDYKLLFEKALHESMKKASERIESTLSLNIKIELHGAYHSGDILMIDEALDSLYLSDELFWFVIDISVKEVNPTYTLMFVRVSGHPPVPLEETWNYASGYGSFKPC